MIVEEGHALRRGVGTPSQPVAKGIAALKLAEVSRMRLMLTGSPIFNYGDEIWHLMRYIRPEVLGDEDDFRREWCYGRVVRNPDALRTYLVEQHAMTRKTGQGPKPNVIVQDVDFDAGRLASVEDLARDLAVRATTGSFEQRGMAVRELDMRLRQETGIAKAPYVAKFVRMVVEAGEKVLLFGWHRDVYDIWLDELSDLGCVMYTGTESPAQKNQAKAKFLAGEASVFIMSLRSGEGVDDLQRAASVAVIGELDWSPKVHDQCIGRLNREGQPRWAEGRRVDAIYLVAADGADPPMMETLGLKASQAHHITDGGVFERHSDLKPMERLIARYLDKGKSGAVA
jgi:SNF2 family DNA or RNA helicase